MPVFNWLQFHIGEPQSITFWLHKPNHYGEYFYAALQVGNDDNRPQPAFAR